MRAQKLDLWLPSKVEQQRVLPLAVAVAELVEACAPPL